MEGDHPSGACLDVGGPGEWDRLFVGWPVVVNHKQKEFRMYYHALDPDSKKFRVGEREGEKYRDRETEIRVKEMGRRDGRTAAAWSTMI